MDVRAVWDGLPLRRRRAVVDLLLTVRVLHTTSGARAFDPRAVKIEWKGVAEMTDKRVQTAEPTRRPFTAFLPRRWGDDDDVVQDARWFWLARVETRVAAPSQRSTIGPFVPSHTDLYRLIQLRCGDGRCRSVVGAVYAVDREWQRGAFTWAELHRVDDAEARPPTVKVNHVVLDSSTTSFVLRAECVRHGLRVLPVDRRTTDKLVAALDGVIERGKSTTEVMVDPT